MIDPRHIEFLSGVYMATFAASGVFFFKFYRDSRDKFFLYFAWSCWLLAIERVVLLSADNPIRSIRADMSEASSLIYVIRLIAFLAIVYAVIDRNRRSRAG